MKVQRSNIARLLSACMHACATQMQLQQKIARCRHILAILFTNQVCQINLRQSCTLLSLLSTKAVHEYYESCQTSHRPHAFSRVQVKAAELFPDFSMHGVYQHSAAGDCVCGGGGGSRNSSVTPSVTATTTACAHLDDSHHPCIIVLVHLSACQAAGHGSPRTSGRGASIEASMCQLGIRTQQRFNEPWFHRGIQQTQWHSIHYTFGTNNALSARCPACWLACGPCPRRSVGPSIHAPVCFIICWMLGRTDVASCITACS